MEQIALIAGQFVFYWKPLLLTAGVVTAIFFFLWLYLQEAGRGLSAACAIPMALILGLLLSRLVHWYCRPGDYGSVSAALTDYSGGWTGTGDAEVSTSPMTTGYVSVSTDGTTSGRVVMDTPISAFGKYKTLSFTANSSQVARFQIYSAGGEVAATKSFAGGTSPVSLTIDISGLSKTETYTCGLSISGTGSAASARVSKIRLE